MKNTILAAFLGFWVFGIFYATGFNKRGFEYFAALLIGSAILSMINPCLGIIINIAGAYFGYKIAEEYNKEKKIEDYEN